jgi:hypothetical protein
MSDETMETIRPVHEVIEQFKRVMSWQPPDPVVTIDFKELASVLLNYHERIQNQEQVIEQLSQRVKTLEAWALQVKREPTFFTEKPLSEHPLYKRDV